MNGSSPAGINYVSNLPCISCQTDSMDRFI